MHRRRALVLTMLMLWLLLMGNSAAPWWACSGKEVGEPCTKPGYGCAGGKCALIEDCSDAPDTDVNECLRCR